MFPALVMVWSVNSLDVIVDGDIASGQGLPSQQQRLQQQRDQHESNGPADWRETSGSRGFIGGGHRNLQIRNGHGPSGSAMPTERVTSEGDLRYGHHFDPSGPSSWERGGDVRLCADDTEHKLKHGREEIEHRRCSELVARVGQLPRQHEGEQLRLQQRDGRVQVGTMDEAAGGTMGDEVDLENGCEADELELEHEERNRSVNGHINGSGVQRKSEEQNIRGQGRNAGTIRDGDFVIEANLEDSRRKVQEQGKLIAAKNDERDRLGEAQLVDDIEAQCSGTEVAEIDTRPRQDCSSMEAYFSPSLRPPPPPPPLQVMIQQHSPSTSRSRSSSVQCAPETNSTGSGNRELERGEEHGLCSPGRTVDVLERMAQACLQAGVILVSFPETLQSYDIKCSPRCFCSIL